MTAKAQRDEDMQTAAIPDGTEAVMDASTFNSLPNEPVATESGRKTPEPIKADSGNEGESPVLVRNRKTLEEALRSGAGVLRDRVGLESALHRLALARDELIGLSGGDAREEYRRCRLQNDLTAALLVCTAALAREDSLGCHIRSDFPDKASQPYRISLLRNADGSARVLREPADA